ncbi:hypothetical protein [Aestuariicoccus sp. MJ-SS9]|uniref:hypothetical protein n=1 Tax=Aestuariicoccus sp. MJ-SS9 TaxID=3079855 RepID=UPI0029149994|nr:hypothetical protein [Aestuariicoccus sp. MJ-SS9]MDU8912696.1 hypothetical protein [Aestuariicoccus sp. MJ-SS9]
MPATFSVLKAHNLVLFRFPDTLTPEINRAVVNAYFVSPEYCETFDFLVDFSDGPRMDITFHSMMHMVLRMEPVRRRRSPMARTAIYAPDDLSFGVARMYQSLVTAEESWQVEVFRDATPALAFLGHAPELAPALCLTH